MNPPNLARRILRNTASYLPYTGLIKPADAFHPQGISAVIRVKDACDWIEASILSIIDFADEIIVADNGSSDGTVEIVKKLSQTNSKIKLHCIQTQSLCELSNISAGYASYRWIVKWDADFIAHTNGKYNISGLRDIILSLDPKRYFGIYLRPVHIFGDLYHVHKTRGYLWIDNVYTYSPYANYVFVGINEGIKLPKYYKTIALHDFFFFHINIKPRKKMFMRYFFDPWQVPANRAAFPTLEEYVMYRINKDWNCKNLKEGESYYVSNILLKQITRYDKTIYGEYPKLLEQSMNKVKYRIIYNHGIPIDRIE